VTHQHPQRVQVHPLSQTPESECPAEPLRVAGHDTGFGAPSALGSLASLPVADPRRALPASRRIAQGPAYDLGAYLSSYEGWFFRVGLGRRDSARPLGYPMRL
jgi:hypothetical protein